MNWQSLALLAMVGCASDGVLYAETLVCRAVCTGRGLAVFGLLPDVGNCEVEVSHLGDGCYVALRQGEQVEYPRQMRRDGGQWNPRLYECAANGPGNRVACLEIPVGSRVKSLGISDPVGIVYYVRMGEDEAHMPTTRRCVPRFEAWEAVYSPPLDRAVVELRDTEGRRARARLREDPLEVAQLYLGGPVLATVCPTVHGGVSVELKNSRYTQSFAQEMIELVEQLSTPPPPECRFSRYFLRLVK